MDKYCSACGGELHEGDRHCTHCGKPVEDVQADVVGTVFSEQAAPEAFSGYTEPSKPKKKVKWWMIAAPIGVAAAIAIACVCIFWNQILVRISPEAALAKAFAEVSGEIITRNEGSPLLVLGNAVDEEQKNTVNMGLYYSDPYSGTLEFNTMIRQDALQGRTQIDVDMIVMEEQLDISMYMDHHAFAFTSDRLVHSKYYGITYDTFSEDIRGNSLFSSLDEETIVMLEEIVEMLQPAEPGSMDFTALSEAYGAIVKDFALEVKPSVSTSKLEGNGFAGSCDVVSYTVSNAQLAALLEQLLDATGQDEQFQKWLSTLEEMDAEAEISLWDDFSMDFQDSLEELKEAEGENVLRFWLYWGELVNVELEMNYKSEDEEEQVLLAAFLGEDCDSGDIVLTVLDSDLMNDTSYELTVTISTEKTETAFSDTIYIRESETGEDTVNAEYSYDWNRKTGAFIFAGVSDTADSESEFQLELKLTETDAGFRVELEDLIGVFADEDTYIEPGTVCSVSLEVSKGAEFETPEFLNIDQWTYSDLMNLMMELYEIAM